MRILAGAIAALMAFSSPANALDQAAMSDKTPVSQCADFPRPSIISAMSRQDGERVCASMMKALFNVRNRDVYYESLVVFIFAHDDYDGGDARMIADKINLILQLRGLSQTPDRWEKTEDILIRAWQAFHQNVAPDDIVAFLASAGRDVAHGLSDEGFINMLAVIDVGKKDK